jgi:hypothetical protein
MCSNNRKIDIGITNSACCSVTSRPGQSSTTFTGLPDPPTPDFAHLTKQQRLFHSPPRPSFGIYATIGGICVI